MNTICFYHRDLDGECSGAQIKLRHPDCEMISINYGERIPWERISSKRETGKGDKIFVVDFCFDVKDMLKLEKFSEQLTWIDHHKTSLDKEELNRITGVRRGDVAGCYLTWEWLNFSSNNSIPKVVKLVSDFDIRDHPDPNVLPFKYGMEARVTDPSKKEGILLWRGLFHPVHKHEYIIEIIEQGKAIKKFADKQMAEIAEQNAFELVFEGVKFIAINTVGRSTALDAVFNKEKHQARLVFFKTNKGVWSVTLYSEANTIDLSPIAKKYGGGGHAGACGFKVDKLPF